MLVKCVEVEYVPGEFTLVNGVGKHVRDYQDGGYKFKNRGTGWGQQVTNSELNLTISVNGKFDVINIVSFFQQNWGKLSEKRRNAIIATMPQTVKVIKGEVSENDLNEWLKSAKEAWGK